MSDSDDPRGASARAAPALSPVTANELRALYPRVLARTLAIGAGLADAEDAVQDAIERALETWPRAGRPDSPEAWLVTVAGNCRRDRHRRYALEAKHADALARMAEVSAWSRDVPLAVELPCGWSDDLLRLVFLCCHPALDAGESAALALATVLGLTPSEVAQGFLVAPRSMEQRLTRARRRLRETGDDTAPEPRRARDRVEAVLRVVHLLYNEGYWSGSDEGAIRGDLCRLAVVLGRALHRTFPDIAEAQGLLALLLLHDARRGARTTEDGAFVRLPEQDRARWDRSTIAEATALLDGALAAGAPGPYQIEAAISAVHCRASTAAETDWTEIAALYALLERARPTAAVRVNRAFAVGRALGAVAGLALLDADEAIDTSTYPYADVVRGALLEEASRDGEAVAALERAAAGARNPHEAAQLRERCAGIKRRAEDKLRR